MSCKTESSLINILSCLVLVIDIYSCATCLHKLEACISCVASSPWFMKWTNVADNYRKGLREPCKHLSCKLGSCYQLTCVKLENQRVTSNLLIFFYGKLHTVRSLHLGEDHWPRQRLLFNHSKYNRVSTILSRCWTIS